MALGLEVKEQAQGVGVVVLERGALADGQRPGRAVFSLIAGLDTFGVETVVHKNKPPCKIKRQFVQDKLPSGCSARRRRP